MNKQICRIIGSAMLAVACHQARAEPPTPMLCSTFTSAEAFDACIGLSHGQPSLAGANAAFGSDSTYSAEYVSGGQVFDIVNSDGDSVTLTFSQDFGGGSAVVALKFGGQGINQLGYFRYDNAAFASGDTLTFNWDPSFGADGNARVLLYGTATAAAALAPVGGVSNVPEPATAALVFTGLVAVGALQRRRRRA